jgi:hypothetical protein
MSVAEAKRLVASENRFALARQSGGQRSHEIARATRPTFPRWERTGVDGYDGWNTIG